MSLIWMEFGNFLIQVAQLIETIILAFSRPFLTILYWPVPILWVSRRFPLFYWPVPTSLFYWPVPFYSILATSISGHLAFIQPILWATSMLVQIVYYSIMGTSTLCLYRSSTIGSYSVSTSIWRVNLLLCDSSVTLSVF